ncbi:D-alanyl-D-alanine carboxypeptidase / D-alanyl-D-alanine-endopeptidase [Candidatus Gastranaerophilus sp. (ex Termes propinquus)]|nr:D-alanyl-D-alanine carboxypeptidase / D-alanyl-D-alanine-endopeptidase [Candidatus Gastranaerophilus sp. (ex Termes propinquus)]
MKKFILRLFTLHFALFFSTNLTFANINQTISNAKLEKNSVASISVRDVQTSKELYARNQHKYVHPASSLKIFTFAAALNELGEDYTFDTKVYADNSGNLYIKLGADPLLCTEDLRALIKQVKSSFDTSKIKNIYIDDTIIDKIPYPQGWMWDDFWPNIPKLSPYTLNQNTTKLTLRLAREGQSAQVIQNDPYKISIINEVTKGSARNIALHKDYDENSDIITIKGTVSGDSTVFVPVSNPKFYFIANVDDILAREKISYKKPYAIAKVPKNAREVAKVSRSIQEVGAYALKNSDNFSSEIIFKVAGGKFKGKCEGGSTQDALDMFFNYYSKLGADVDGVKISDASGVSRYNLFTTSWMSDALLFLNSTNVKNYMAQAGEGTLDRRLVHLKGRLWAKTGTLSGVSSLAGYVKNSKDKELVFAVVISNFNKKPSVIKSFEDDLVDDIFKF